MEPPVKKFKGSLKLIILNFLKEEPLHGYGIMQRLSEFFKDYTPSPGVVYPILASLKRSGYIETVSEGKRDKKVYKITEKGLEYLEKNREELERILRHIKTRAEFLDRGGRELRDAIILAVRKLPELNEKQKRELEEIMRECAKKIRFIVEFGGE
ncbi:PadR family transcriptional regulator [Thermococcus paralvinellae]|uniref:Transcriptional regulator, PadR family n=1 Tax=Thermococcus paralvinellae TaxID=582419 RepID=W0I870_9EURY|nr:PadR family transcriptional regulator [Thermococcus paralvinellae]AHF80618.1 Transcriptional regulator, PadR family [Thermococcus paralvinellae]